jgi:hypothetical protein
MITANQLRAKWNGRDRWGGEQNRRGNAYVGGQGVVSPPSFSAAIVEPGCLEKLQA